MEKGPIKFLTQYLALFLVAGQIFAAPFVTREKAPTHLRWSLFVPEHRVLIEKNKNRVVLKSLDRELLSSVHKDIKSLPIDGDYIASISDVKLDKGTNAHYVEVEVAGEGVKLFFFYRRGEKRYILDYWHDGDFLKTVASAPEQSAGETPPSIPANSVVLRKEKIDKPRVIKEVRSEAKRQREEGILRDFRYGASFIWDYPALISRRGERINIARKTAEFFYPVKDRHFKKSEREAHLQLAINLYRKKKWGLMYKALGLFQERYGYKRDTHFIEYLKANALIREKFSKGYEEPAKEGISIYENITGMDGDYQLRKGLMKYLVEYYLEKENYVSALKNAKSLYVLSKENFDYEEFKEQSTNILYSLAKLNQIDKLQKVLQEKMIVKFVPGQRLLAYELYSLLSLGKAEEVVALYEKRRSSLVAPVEATILYNVGEAYFREARYKEAIVLFDKFIRNNSFYKESENTRLRMALGFDLMEKPYDQVRELYQNAINRSSGIIAYEAKIRYVGLTSLRMKKPTEKAVEERVFLEKKDKNKQYSKNIDQLLWLVRLRTLVVKGEFKKALSYLSAIPVASMLPSHRRVFEADGGEAVYGMIEQLYKDSNYSEVVKVWKIYKEKYISKTARDPHLRYLVGSAYLHLDLFDAFEEVLVEFSQLKDSPEKTFPLWVERKGSLDSKIFDKELRIMANVKMGNYHLALEGIKELDRFSKNKKTDYWKAYIHYNKKEYKKAIKHFESFLVGLDVKTDLGIMEVADLLKGYTDSVYQLGEVDKFLRISEAILKDARDVGRSNKYMNSIKERISYFRIESLFGKQKPEGLKTLEPMVADFLKDYPESSHGKRMEYILGLSLIRNKEEKKGKEILETLLSQGTTSEIIKEMIRSELTLMKIKEVEI